MTFTDGSERIAVSEEIEATRIEPALPEFVDAKGLRSLFGISRAQGYLLAGEGKVRTVCIRRPGAVRGKRLWDCASIRAFLNKHAVGGEQ